MSEAWDEVVELQAGGDRIQVRLARGGQDFPWRVVGESVRIGGPREAKTAGKAGSDWKVSPFWVVEAVKIPGGVPVDLTATQFIEAMALAEKLG